MASQQFVSTMICIKLDAAVDKLPFTPSDPEDLPPLIEVPSIKKILEKSQPVPAPNMPVSFDRTTAWWVNKLDACYPGVVDTQQKMCQKRIVKFSGSALTRLLPGNFSTDSSLLATLRRTVQSLLHSGSVFLNQHKFLRLNEYALGDSIAARPQATRPFSCPSTSLFREWRSWLNPQTVCTPFDKNKPEIVFSCPHCHQMRYFAVLFAKPPIMAVPSELKKIHEDFQQRYLWTNALPKTIKMHKFGFLNMMWKDSCFAKDDPNSATIAAFKVRQLGDYAKHCMRKLLSATCQASSFMLMSIQPNNMPVMSAFQVM